MAAGRPTRSTRGIAATAHRPGWPGDAGGIASALGLGRPANREEQQDLLRASLRLLQDRAGTTAALFQGRLCEVAPDLGAVLGRDGDRHAAMLMNMLGIIAARLQDLSPMQPLLVDLAERHGRYGAAPRHYRLLGEALVWTLERALGPRFDRETRAAWIDAYAALAGAMAGAGGDPSLDRVAAFTPPPASAPRPAASAHPSPA